MIPYATKPESNVSRFLHRRLYLVLLAPALLILGFVNVWPIVWSLYLSLTNRNLLNPMFVNFTGLKNYFEALKDPLFWLAAKQSLIYTVSVVALQFLIGLTLALALNRKLPGRGAFRALVLIPWVIPSAIAALSWIWMLDGLVGVVNDVLHKLGLISKFIPFLSQPHTAMLSVILVTVWKGFPFMAVMLLAALQTVSQDIYEAAEVDGASSIGRFFFITLPSIRHTVYITIILALVWTFNFMDAIWIMTKGGPIHSTEILVTYTYKMAFQSFEFGYSSALSVIILIMLAVFAYLYLRTFEREELE